MSHKKDHQNTPVLYNKLIYDKEIGQLMSTEETASVVPEHLASYCHASKFNFAGKFIKGPIPLPGLLALSHTKSDKILFTVSVIFHLFSFIKNDEEFRFKYAISDDFGLSRSTVKRHLRTLESLNLISLKIEQSKSPKIGLNLKNWGYFHVKKL